MTGSQDHICASSSTWAPVSRRQIPGPEADMLFTCRVPSGPSFPQAALACILPPQWLPPLHPGRPQPSCLFGLLAGFKVTGVPASSPCCVLMLVSQSAITAQDQCSSPSQGTLSQAPTGIRGQRGRGLGPQKWERERFGVEVLELRGLGFESWL